MSWSPSIAGQYLADFVRSLYGEPGTGRKVRLVPEGEDSKLRAKLLEVRKALEERDVLCWKKVERQKMIEEIDEVLSID